MKISTIILMIFFSLQIYAQEVIKDYDFVKSVYGYTIKLSGKNEYTFRLYKFDTVLNDVDWGIVLSFGKVAKNGNSLILSDFLTQSRMVVDTSNNKLKIKNSFHFAENKTLKFTYEHVESLKKEFEDYIKAKSYKAHLLTRYKYNETTSINDLPYGTYTSPAYVFHGIYRAPYYMYSRPGFLLVLAEPHNYKLSIGGFLISEGIFTRNKNILLLYDTSMDHIYHLLIETDGLKSMMMPGDVEGVSLKYDAKQLKH